MKKTSTNYVYVLGGKAYINLTNRCPNACDFCLRRTGDGVGDAVLWLEGEPTADDVMAAFALLPPDIDNEAVFCGYGEPTERLDVLISSARRLKEMGRSTRLNTNGLGDLINGREIAGELKGLIDTVSISLDQCDAQKYLDITHSAFGPDAFPAIIRFAKSCKAAGMNTVFTVVDVIGKDDIALCRGVAERAGIPLRVREYISDNYAGGGK